jgi:hypothetical protein
VLRNKALGSYQQNFQETEPFRSPHHCWHCHVEHGNSLSGRIIVVLRTREALDQGISIHHLDSRFTLFGCQGVELNTLPPFFSSEGYLEFVFHDSQT